MTTPETPDCNFSQLFKTSYVPDLTIPGETPRDLLKQFREPEEGPAIVPARTDINIEARGEQFISPTLSAYNIIDVDEKNRQKIDKGAIVDYLRACRVVYENGIPYRYEGGCYQEQDPEYIRRMIYDAVERADRQGLPRPPFLSSTAVNDVISKLRATSMPEDIPISREVSDNEDYWEGDLIPFENGLYNVQADTLLPFTPDLFITHKLQACYMPAITEHPVEEVYKGILPDDDTRRFFYQMVGYSLFSPTMSPPAIFLIYGPGNTGKTALQSAVIAAAGYRNTSALDLTQITDKFGTSELLGKLINFSGETGTGKTRGDLNQVDGELLKRLSDGQPIAVQRKYGQMFTMNNTAKLWFVSNTLPNFGDTSSGLYRRLYIIPCRIAQDWSAQIYKRLTDPAAVSWLINKAVQGYKEFLANGRGFDISDEMAAELNAYKIQNPLMDFMEYRFGTMDKHIIRSKLEGIFVNELHADYKTFVEASGGRPMASRMFAETVRNEFNLKTVKERVTGTNGLPTNWRKFTSKN